VSAGSLATGRSNTTVYAVAVLSLLAAAIHLWAAPEHFEEWWGYGVFFLAAAGAQGMYALVLLRWSGRSLFILGIAGNLSIVILWLVTRTSGIPLFGPHAGEVEGSEVLDLACTLAEVGIVALLGILTMKGPPTQGRIQIVVVLVVSALFFWHLLHLLARSSPH